MRIHHSKQDGASIKTKKNCLHCLILPVLADDCGVGGGRVGLGLGREVGVGKGGWVGLGEGVGEGGWGSG